MILNDFTCLAANMRQVTSSTKGKASKRIWHLSIIYLEMTDWIQITSEQIVASDSTVFFNSLPVLF